MSLDKRDETDGPAAWSIWVLPAGNRYNDFTTIRESSQGLQSGESHRRTGSGSSAQSGNDEAEQAGGSPSHLMSAIRRQFFLARMVHSGWHPGRLFLCPSNITSAILLKITADSGQWATARNKSDDCSRTAAAIFADPAFDSTAKEKRASISAILRSIPKEIQESPYPPTTKRMLPRVARLPNTAAEAALIEPSLQTITGHQPQRYIDRYALESVARGLHRPRLKYFTLILPARPKC